MREFLHCPSEFNLSFRGAYENDMSQRVANVNSFIDVPPVALRNSARFIITRNFETRSRYAGYTVNISCIVALRSNVFNISLCAMVPRHGRISRLECALGVRSLLFLERIQWLRNQCNSRLLLAVVNITSACLSAATLRSAPTHRSTHALPLIGAAF